MDQLSRLHRPYYRNGPPHRDGADVSFADVRKLFSFRSIQIGRWVTAQEQQLAANLFFDALCDLMDILQVPEQVISLNGTLALAFGTGGQKYSAAHYAPGQRMLAMAKNAGGGALAHEWFHAFDHYICTRMYADCSADLFASQAFLQDKVLVPHPLNQRLQQCFQYLFVADDGEQPTPYVMNSAKADKVLGAFYYAQPQEMAARAFEAVVQDNPRKNAFLVQGTKQSTEANIGIYPKGQHLARLTQAFHRYFVALGDALDG
ncbi:hypothetical protein LJ739_16590 [Aestuariibacter halophilus]|uniref:Large polyvalent protein-associated domain-containing protein n=1 Tax=Fluctibacter halophilus TaxID=226011 RepID=A0ABS8GBA4_9ALTE|nr:CLCA_X family protein [Aestuariibacter halophilus]MCC2617872.1 hypothetical protein [Aestuariibacter halophilus]